MFSSYNKVAQKFADRTKERTALKPDLKPKLPSCRHMIVEDRDFVIPLYNCTTVVKLKMPITLATDVLETYTLHFWKWEKKFL